MLKKIILSITGLLFLSSLIFSQGKQELVKESSKKDVLSKVNFTDEQKSKIKTLKLELEKKNISVNSKIQLLRVELKELFSADKLDKIGIEKKLNEISKLQVEQKMNQLNHWSDINDILTPEQQKIWKEKRKNFGGIDQPNERFNQRMGMRQGMHRGMRKGERQFRGRPMNEPPPQDVPNENIKPDNKK